MSIERVSSIIGKSTNKPTIVNNDSKFVVVTYWWGRGNLNANIARPCISYYEEMIQKGLKSVINFVTLIYKQKPTELNKLIIKSIDTIKIYKPYISFLKKASNSYIDMLYEMCKIDKKKVANAENKLIQCLEEMKKEGKISESFVYKSHSDIRLLFNMIIKEIVRMNVDRISALILLEEEVVKLKETFTKKNNINDEIKDRIKREINEKVILKKGI